MSNTHDIVCEDCKVKLWFGQASTQSGLTIYDYRDGDGTNLLARFLLDHKGHRLVVEDEYSDYDPDVKYLQVGPWGST